MLRDFATHLETMHRDGWLLRERVHDDYGFAYHPDPEVMAKTLKEYYERT